MSEPRLEFEHWPCQQIKVPNGSVYLRYRGNGRPVLLVHGVPQHSLMYHSVATRLASWGFAVLVPDLPGMGQSVHNGPDKLTSLNASKALHAVAKFFGISRLSVFAYDKGCGPAVLLARDYPDLVESLIVAEYALPGFGHELIQQPSADKTLFDHWHLGIFTLPEAATFLIRGREEQFLTWYFWHAAYSGLNAIKPEHFRRYVQEWQRPGGLEAGIEFLGGSIWTDIEEFRSVSVRPRMLAVGGEASMGKPGLLAQLWGPVSSQPLETAVVRRAGHWLGDENPEGVAKIIRDWLDQSTEPATVVSLTD